MTDIVDLLRADSCYAAAAEIERLRAENATLRHNLEVAMDSVFVELRKTEPWLVNIDNANLLAAISRIREKLDLDEVPMSGLADAIVAMIVKARDAERERCVRICRTARVGVGWHDGEGLFDVAGIGSIFAAAILGYGEKRDGADE